MITPIDEHLINDHTEQSRSKLMKSTIILDSGKRERITLTIMDAGNNIHRRVHTTILNHMRLKMSMEMLYDKFNGG